MAERRTFTRALASVTLAALAFILLGSTAYASVHQGVEGVTELFFSEYIEGSSYNKALEIYNGTGSPVDLGAYSIEFYFNGSATAAVTIPLSGILADEDVFVVADDGSAADILAVTDLTDTANFYNGDDAVVLSKAGVPIDVIGQIGFDPGSYWGTGDNTTQNHTLRRLATITGGDADGSDAFDPAAEWLSFPQDTFDGLGSHTAGSVPPAYTPIYDIQYTTDPSGDSPLAGTADVTTEGVVTASFYNGFFIEDPAGGPWTGLYVYDSSMPSIGDLVSITGSVSEYYNLTEMGSLTDLTIMSTGNSLPAAEVLATGDVSQEAYEGVLVQVVNVTVSNGDMGYGEWSVNDGSGDVVLDDKGSYSYVPTTGDLLASVTGPLDYTFGVFKILPRDDGDIVSAAPSFTPIYDMQFTSDPSGASPLAGESGVTTEGIVTGVYSNGYFIEDPAGGAWSGVFVYDFSGPIVGDYVHITGSVSEYYGFTELGSLTDFAVLSSGNALPAPAVLPTGDVSQEQWEGVLVRVENVTVTNGDMGYGEWSVNDGSGDVVLDDKGSYTYSPTTGDTLAAVIGPLDYSFSVFKILPRDDGDILFEIPVPEVIINEIDSDTSGTEVDEFIELYDGGVGYTPLDGLVVVLYNGSDNLSYGDSFDLDGYTTNSEGYFVIGGTGITGVDLVVPGSYWLQNGADAVTLLVGNASDYPNDSAITTDNLVDAIVYGTNDSDDADLLVLLNPGQPQANESAAGASYKDSLQRCPNGEGGARNTDTYAPYDPTPGAENTCGGGVVVFGSCGDTAAYIHDIQGPGDTSPVVGEIQVMEGVVVGDFQNTSNQLRGFFLQEEDTDVDTNPLTSEGIFVYDNGFLDVNVGDHVRVMGTVTEYYGMTEVNNISDMAVCGTGTASASEIYLPVPSLAVWEQYEGMLVHFPQTLYATGNYDLGRYGELDLSISMLDTPTNVVLPGTEAIALQELNDRSRIQLDDGSTIQNPPVAPYMEADNTLRAGDSIPGLTGVINYSHDFYQVDPTEALSFTRENQRPAAPADLGGPITVASFNVLNYFSTIDDGNWICGPSMDMECRGADTPEEFDHQRTKIINAILAMDADVVGLMELENNPTDAALQDLVNGLNDIAGAGTYAYVDTGAVGTDAIKVALIYQPARVSLLGSPAILTSEVDPTFNDDYNRPAVAQTFRHVTGEVFTVAVNHLKSKGSDCNALGDPDTGDGQGNCNLTRVAAAEALANWLASDPTGSGDPDYLIIGDLNSYAMEDPITALKNNGYTNLVEMYQGVGAYSYQFYGQRGYLDQALATASLADKATGAEFWHINADEPSALDYNDYNQAYLYTPEFYRASDHDPVLVGICDAVAPELTVNAEYEAAWPPNHKMFPVQVSLDIFDPTGGVSVSLVSVTSNEPELSTNSEMHNTDIVILDDFNFELRAERLGNGDGRVYTITYLVVDGCGNSTYASVDIVIQHDAAP